MRAREADARLEMIRSLMQRGSRWPGLSAGAVFGAAIGAFATAAWCRFRGLDFTSTPGTHDGYVGLYGTSAVPTWCTLAVGCFVGFVTATAAGASRRGEPPMSRQTWAALFSIAPSLFAGTFLSAALPIHFLPAVWMLCYGTGVCALGWFAGFPATLAGLLFLVGGGLTLLTPLSSHPLAMLAATFGGIHALLGAHLLLQPRDHHDSVHFDPLEDR